MMTGTTQEKIEKIPMGKAFSDRQDSTFIQVARGFGANGGYVISCGWVVKEAHDDDYGSYSAHPFKTQTPRPWVGRQIKASSAGEAATIYDQWKAALNSHASPTGGETIGSVRR